MNLPDFKKALEEWPERVAAPIAAKMQRDMLTDLVEGFVDDNPVGDPSTWASPAPPGYQGGHSKRNWRVYLHREYAAAERDGVDPLGVTAKTEADIVISRITNKPVSFCTISNPVPYMDALANGWSKQAPAGWIEAVVAQVTARYDRKVAVRT